MEETHAQHRAAGYAPGGPWTPALDAQLVTMWYDGLPTATIGERLGITKNAVIGRKNRLNLTSRQSPIKGGPVVRMRRKPAPIVLPDMAGKPTWTVTAAIVRTSDPMAPLPQFPRVPPAAALRIPRGAIGPARTCQWTDCERAPWLFCDAPSTAGYSYCPDHKAVVFKVPD
jgi:GcrA cell cycle regulator